MVKSLRASLVDETDCLYCIHTPLGVINVSTWEYRLPGYVAVTGRDEGNEYRFAVFSEEAMRHFPLEIKRKSLEASKEVEASRQKESIGFKPSPQGGTEDQA